MEPVELDGTDLIGECYDPWADVVTITGDLGGLLAQHHAGGHIEVARSVKPRPAEAQMPDEGDAAGGSLGCPAGRTTPSTPPGRAGPFAFGEGEPDVAQPGEEQQPGEHALHLQGGERPHRPGDERHHHDQGVEQRVEIAARAAGPPGRPAC